MTRIGSAVAVVTASWMLACGPASDPFSQSQGGPGAQISVTVSPASATVQSGDIVHFTASVSGAADTSVDWSIREGSTGGSIASDGTYVAAGVAGTYHVIAAARADRMRLAIAEVTVAPRPPSPVTVKVDPASVRLGPSGIQRFVATVTGNANSTVTWSVVEPQGGTIDAAGNYAAPATAGNFHVKAVSVADTTAFALASIEVAATPVPISVSVAPAAVSLQTGGTQQFTATVSGTTTDRAVTWSVQEASGGTIDAQGRYTAPASAGSFHVVATSNADKTRSAAAAVEVRQASSGTLSISPSQARLIAGDTLHLSVTSPQPGSTKLTIAEGATFSTAYVTSAGDFVGVQPGTWHVVATNAADGSTSVATYVVTANGPAVRINNGQSVTLRTGGVVVLDASAIGFTETKFSWRVQEASGGQIEGLANFTSRATYTAPSTAGVYYLQVASVSDPLAIATLPVNVSPHVFVDHGGRVLPSTTTYALWWGKTPDPSVQRSLEIFLDSLDGTAYLALLDQYMRGAKTRTRFGRTFIDPAASPSIGATNDSVRVIADEVCAVLDRNGIAPSSDAVYFVFPSNWGNGYGGWHSAASCHGTLIAVAAQATSDPWITAHELFEAITDPEISAWWFEPLERGTLDEIADECETGRQVALVVGAFTWFVPQMYSQAAGGCAAQ